MSATTSETVVQEQLEETEGGVTSQRDNHEEQLRAHFLMQHCFSSTKLMSAQSF